VSCHGTNKVKGDLLLNTPENILKGGKNGSILTADKDKEAMMFERIHLDITHKKHMPPDGKLQLTTEEVAILSRWIKAGGDFKTKMNELAKTDTLFLLANKYTPADNTKVEVKTGLPDLAEYNSNYCTVNYLYHGSDAIEVNFFQGSFYSRDVLKKLEKLKDQVVRLNMQGMPLNNEDVSIISQFNNVENINLNYTKLDLKTIEPLKQLKKLKLLSICGLSFTESELTNFLKGSTIANINIWSSVIGKTQLEKLAARYPKTKFTIGDNLESKVLKINPPTIDQDSSIISKFLDVKMKHMLNGVTIRYTLNGVDPDSLTSPIYKNTLRLTRNTNLKIKVFKPGWISSDIIQRNFYKSEIRPDSIYLISSPDQKYLGNGAKTLVDLELGGSNFTNKKWLGYKDTTMKFMVNFKQPRVLHQAFLNSLIDVGSYVFPIVSITVEGSNDGIKFAKITETKFNNSNQFKNLCICTGTKRDGWHLSPYLSKVITMSIYENKTPDIVKKFSPNRKLILNMTREQAIAKSVKHLLSAAYQHEYNPSSITMDMDLSSLYYDKISRLHDEIGAVDWGIPVDMIGMYKYGHIK
jgi:hypothetical protein